jgi:hypothetical protein
MALGEADCKLWTPPPPDVPDDSGPGVRILDAGGALVALGAWQRVPGGQRVAFNRAESPRTETMRAPEGHHLLHPRVVLF